MLHSAGQLYRSTRSVPKGQLYRRLQLNIRRWWMPKVGRYLVGRSRPATVRLAAVLPASLFAPREHLVRQTPDGPCLSQLGSELPLSPPVDWLCRSHPGTRHLDRLALHYHEFLESLTFEEGWAIVDDWIHQNPPWQPGYWLDSWNSYAISIRCVCWFQWWERYRDRLSPEQQERLGNSLFEQVLFLEQNLETDICGNHLIKNLRCLFWASGFFEGEDAQRWNALARKMLAQELRRQFLSDGMHYELSPAYHCQVVGDLLECAWVMEGAAKSKLIAAIEAMMAAMRTLTHPDGLISLFSDGGLHMAYSPSEIEEVWGRQTASTPNSSGHPLTSSGYYHWRSERQWLLIDCGSVCEDSLPAHGHADMLAFEWDVDGHRIIVDNGVFEYEAGARRRYDRSVTSHNTVQVDSQDQAEFIGSFRTGWRYRAQCEEVRDRDGSFELIGSHDAYRCGTQRLKHRRRFLANSLTLLIEDQLLSYEGNGGESTRAIASARFLFHDACRLEKLTDHSIRIVVGSTRLTMQSSAVMRIVQAQWSPDFGQRVATHRVEATFASVPGSASFQFMLES
jgi:uncharacterized heparinase superfamily protein